MKKRKETEADPHLISYMTIRKVIGLIGIFMPAALLTGTLAFGDCVNIQQSISHYYYTIMGNVFTGALCAVGLFLITYRGYKDDYIFTNIAGVFAFGIGFFPTSNNPDCGIFHFTNQPGIIPVIHYVSAAIFFITLAYISIFLFTKTDKQKTTGQKKKRNTVYHICGYTIILCIIIIALLKIKVIGNQFEQYRLVFWMEWFALIAFGTSWLVKGEAVLKDK